MEKGRVIKRTNCRICGNKSFRLILDLGVMPHAGNFLTKSELGKEFTYPLKIWQCKKCSLVQILDVIPSEILFKNYHYLSSVSLSKHFEKYASDIKNKFLPKDSFVVEIGSNDGVLLGPLKKLGFKVLGVDPAENIVKIAQKKGLETLTGNFNRETAGKIIKKYGKADAVFANNVFAHIDDIGEVVRGIKLLLKKDGIVVIEVHYFPELIKKLQYDFFYNEHLMYYTLGTLNALLNKFGLTVFDAVKIPVHSGSIRVYAKFKNSARHKITKRFMKMLNEEKRNPGLSVRGLFQFAEKAVRHKELFVNFIDKLAKDGGRIVGYGASGRANTLLNFCGINNNKISYITDASPERYGKFTPGSHIPILDVKHFRKDKKVKYAVLFAWNYKDRILGQEKSFIKRGGKFVIPFPEIKII